MAVKNSLKKHLSWWRENIKNEYIVNVIAEGYKLPLIEIPTSEYLQNNKSARENPVFVSEEISRLKLSGVLKEVTAKPTVVNAYR